MILNNSILVVLIIFLFINYKKAVVFLAVFAINIGFFQFPTLGTVWNFAAFIAILLFFVRDDGLKIFKHPLCWCLVLPLLSTVFSMPNFAVTYILKTIIPYVFPIILYYTLKKMIDIHFYMKWMTVFLMTAVAYCFFEEITRTNPIMEWCYNHQENFTWMTSRIANMEMRFGFKRAQSFFSGEAAFATVCIYYWFVILKLRNYQEKKNNRILLFLLITLPLCILFTGTRSAFIAFGIISMSLLSWDSVKTNKTIYILSAFLIIYFSPFFTQIYDSILYSNDSGIGSSEDMREGQWEIAMFYMAKNLWTGNGLGYHGFLLNSDMSGIFGLEGMWLPIMIDQGILGVLSVISGYVITSAYLIWKKQYSLIFVLLSFLAFKTMTTVVGVEQTYYLFIVVFLIRYKELSEEMNIDKR